MVDVYIVHSDYPTLEEEYYWLKRRRFQWRCSTGHNQARNDGYVLKNWWEEVYEVDNIYNDSFGNVTDDAKSLYGFDSGFDDNFR